ncbi:MAG: hypothetical protein ACREPM_13780 [Gemmatimonadaceae bacterium]
MARFATGAALVCGVALRAGGQETIFERLNLDKLQLNSLGASAGKIYPSQLIPTTIYSLGADYGEIAPAWRVLFGASYWESRFRDGIVQAFVDSLNRNTTTGQATVQASRILLYDVTLSVEARYTPQQSNDLKPFFGVGLAAHAVNAEGKLINGTFVERSLDNIGVGVFANTGVSVKLLKHFGVEVSARGDLLSSFRSIQLRGGATYYFGHVRGMQPPEPPPPPSGGDGTDRP